MVECSRKLEKNHRLENFQVFKRDVLKAFNFKAKQLSNTNVPTMVSIYIPENLDWHKFVKLPVISDMIMEKFENHEYQNISGITIVSSRLPKVRIINENIEYSNYDSDVFSMVNGFSKYKLPDDFYYGIGQSSDKNK